MSHSPAPTFRRFRSENVHRDLRHLAGRFASTVEARVFDHLRPITRAAAAELESGARQSVALLEHSTARARSWWSSHPGMALGLAFGVGMVLAVFNPSRRQAIPAYARSRHDRGKG